MIHYLRPLILACLLFGVLPSCAETLVYKLEVFERHRVNYEVFFDVQQPGELTVHADWTGSRVLAFRLHPPDDTWKAYGRAGPPPQQFAIEVDESQVRKGKWRLAIRGLSSHGAGEGRITVQLPDATPTESIPQLDTVPATPRDPWTLPRRADPDLPETWRALFQSTERFRSLVVMPADGRSADSCRWQDDLLRFLVEHRDALVERGSVPDVATRRVLQDIVKALHAVESLRGSTDPALAGPPPRKDKPRRAWMRQRNRRVEEIESILDRALESVRRDQAPELAQENWPLRFVSCMTACERHFEERVRLGQDRATNRDLAQAQWTVALAAGDALSRLVRLEDPPR